MTYANPVWWDGSRWQQETRGQTHAHTECLPSPHVRSLSHHPNPRARNRQYHLPTSSTALAAMLLRDSTNWLVPIPPQITTGMARTCYSLPRPSPHSLQTSFIRKAGTPQNDLARLAARSSLVTGHPPSPTLINSLFSHGPTP